jgi:hypothetical protein
VIRDHLEWVHYGDIHNDIQKLGGGRNFEHPSSLKTRGERAREMEPLQTEGFRFNLLFGRPFVNFSVKKHIIDCVFVVVLLSCENP